LALWTMDLMRAEELDVPTIGIMGKLKCFCGVIGIEGILSLNLKLL
jgi:hypothetical protein